MQTILSFLKKFLWGSAFFFVFAVVVYLLVAFNFSFSEGERVGNIQKLSKKGWVCKTWEGEMLLITQPGVVAEKFNFTVRDEELVKQMNLSLGSKVALTYEQHRGIPTTCFGETEYFAKKITLLPAN